MVGGALLPFAVLALAWWMARRLSLPITALAQAARSVAAGDRKLRAAESGAPEVAGLVRQRNAMLDVRQQGEHELAHCEHRRQRALRGANDGRWDWGPPSQRRFYSPRWWTMPGCEPDEMLSDQALWQRLMHPQGRGRCRARLRWCPGRSHCAVRVRVLPAAQGLELGAGAVTLPHRTRRGRPAGRCASREPIPTSVPAKPSKKRCASARPSTAS